MIHRSVTVNRGSGNQGARSADEERESGVKRKAAEWTTLGVSVAILLGLTGYLVYEGVTPDAAFIPVSATPLLDQVRRVDQRFVLPVEISNPGRKTVTNLQVELRTANGVEVEINIDYLGQRAKQTVYAMMDVDPRQTTVTVEPRIYSAE
jgi:uncharacterized protein (TIGR02588 family)